MFCGFKTKIPCKMENPWSKLLWVSLGLVAFIVLFVNVTLDMKILDRFLDWHYSLKK